MMIRPAPPCSGSIRRKACVAVNGRDVDSANFTGRHRKHGIDATHQVGSGSRSNPGSMNQAALSSPIRPVADRLRDSKQSEPDKVILPFAVLRRLGCMLEPSETAVRAEAFERLVPSINAPPFPLRKAGLDLYYIARLDMKRLRGDPARTPENAFADIQGFSASVRDIFERSACHTQLDPLAKAGPSYPVTERFARLSVDHANSAVCQARIRDLPDASRKTGEWGGDNAWRFAHSSAQHLCGIVGTVCVVFVTNHHSVADGGVRGACGIDKPSRRQRESDLARPRL